MTDLNIREQQPESEEYIGVGSSGRERCVTGRGPTSTSTSRPPSSPIPSPLPGNANNAFCPMINCNAILGATESRTQWRQLSPNLEYICLGYMCSLYVYGYVWTECVSLQPADISGYKRVFTARHKAINF